MVAGEGPNRPDTPGRPRTPATSRPQQTPEASSAWADMLDWIRGRLVTAGRGLLFLGLALAGLIILLAVLTILGLSVALAIKATDPYQRQTDRLIEAIGVFVFWIVMGPVFLLCFRPAARLTRRLAGQWCGVPIAAPYLPRPWAGGGKAGLRRRLTWLLTDQATWRDLLWVTVNGLVGWILPVVPATVLVKKKNQKKIKTKK